MVLNFLRSNSICLILVTAFSLLIPTCWALAQESPLAGFSRERLAVMDQAIQAEVDAGNIAGIVVAVARHGQIVHNKAYGFSDRENRELMTRNHLPESIPSINNGNGPAATGYGLGVSVTLDPAKLGNMDSVVSFGDDKFSC